MRSLNRSGVYVASAVGPIPQTIFRTLDESETRYLMSSSPDYYCADDAFELSYEGPSNGPGLGSGIVTMPIELSNSQLAVLSIIEALSMRDPKPYPTRERQWFRRFRRYSIDPEVLATQFVGNRHEHQQIGLGLLNDKFDVRLNLDRRAKSINGGVLSFTEDSPVQLQIHIMPVLHHGGSMYYDVAASKREIEQLQEATTHFQNKVHRI